MTAPALLPLESADAIVTSMTVAAAAVLRQRDVSGVALVAALTWAAAAIALGRRRGVSQRRTAALCLLAGGVHAGANLAIAVASRTTFSRAFAITSAAVGAGFTAGYTRQVRIRS